MNKYNLNSQINIYCDNAGNGDPYYTPETQRLLSSKLEEYGAQQYNYSEHYGLINMFPLMFGLITDEAVLNATLDLLSDSRVIFSPYGMRSLSMQDKYYHQTSDYWRGIYIYLTLRKRMGERQLFSAWRLE